jgi:hypothetical protein
LDSGFHPTVKQRLIMLATQFELTDFFEFRPEHFPRRRVEEPEKTVAGLDPLRADFVKKKSARLVSDRIGPCEFTRLKSGMLMVVSEEQAVAGFDQGQSAVFVLVLRDPQLPHFARCIAQKRRFRIKRTIQDTGCRRLLLRQATRHGQGRATVTSVLVPPLADVPMDRLELLYWPAMLALGVWFGGRSLPALGDVLAKRKTET